MLVLNLSSGMNEVYMGREESINDWRVCNVYKVSFLDESISLHFNFPFSKMGDKFLMFLTFFLNNVILIDFHAVISLFLFIILLVN